MDVEGLLNNEDYVAPEAEKQIAKMPNEAPKDDEESYLTPPEDEEEESEANKILDGLELPNYDDVEKRLAEPEMTATRQRNYLEKVIKDAETRRRQAVAIKSKATKKFKAGKITGGERDLAPNSSDLLQKEIKNYKKHYQSKIKTSKVQDENREEEEPIFLMMQKKCYKS